MADYGTVLGTALGAFVIATGSFVFGGTVADSAGRRLPDAFQQAASVGRFTQEQAASACTHAEARLNRQLKDARGDNAFTPVQDVYFHCAQAAVTSNPPGVELSPKGP